MDLAHIVENYLVTWLLVLFLLSDCSGVFTNDEPQLGQYQTIIETGIRFSRLCSCRTPESHYRQDLKWLDPQGRIIGPPDLESKIYTQEEENGLGLYIPNMSKSLSGTYKCVHANNNERCYTLNLKAYDKLYFHRNTKTEQNLILGKDQLVICDVRGDGPLNIQWEKIKDDEVIPINESEKYKLDFRGLIIKNVQKEDQSTYRCKCFTLKGIDTQFIQIDIKVNIFTKPVIKELIAVPNKTVIVGESLSIECVAESIPKPSYIWSKTSGKSLVAEANKRWVQNGNKITIDTVFPEDHGTYECTAYNEVDNVTMSIPIEVLYDPTITRLPNVTAIAGEKAELTCEAEGNPIPTLYLGGSESANNHAQVDEKHLSDIDASFTLIFPSVWPSDAGFYECNASNMINTVSETMYLNVLYAPIIKNDYDKYWGWYDKLVNITCDYDANPKPIITWSFHNNHISVHKEVLYLLTRLNKEQNKTLLIQIPNRNFYGEYICVVQNDIGNTSKSFYLSEAFTPGEIRAFPEEVLAKTAIFNVSTPLPTPGASLLGYKAKYIEADQFNLTDIFKERSWGLDREVKLDKLKRDTKYFIKFVALNEVGDGVWTDFITFKTPLQSRPERPMWKEPAIISNAYSSYTLRWITPEDNGAPIKYYKLRICPAESSVNETDNRKCNYSNIEPTNELNLDFLELDKKFNINIMAYNSEGDSDPIDIYFTRRNPEPKTTLSAGAIIGISIAIVVLALLALDIVMLVWKRKGVTARLCLKKKKNKDKVNTKDRKGLLKNNEDSVKKPDNEHKEFEYNKTTGAITGKQSFV